MTAPPTQHEHERLLSSRRELPVPRHLVGGQLVISVQHLQAVHRTIEDHTAVLDEHADLVLT